MVKQNHKEPLNKEQLSILRKIYKNKIAIEISLVLFLLATLGLHPASIWPAYNTINSIVLVFSGFSLLVYGTAITANILLMGIGEPLESRVPGLRTQTIMVWCWIPVFITALILSNTIAADTPIGIKSALLIIILLLFLANIIWVLVMVQLLWRKFNKKRNFPIQALLYSALGLVILLVVVFGAYDTVEDLKYKTITVSDSSLELRQTEVRQPGENGQKQITRNLIFGFVTSTKESDAVNEIIAKGTRRYQYMYCSNGSYRYYTAEQFKNPEVGFTHQSEDYCAKNGQGTQTALADTPPAPPTQTIIRRSPTSFNCYSLHSGSVSCYGY